jgi:hypothetical protein
MMTETGTAIMQTPSTNEARKPPGRPFGPDNKPKGGSEKGSRRLPRLLREMRLIVEKGLPAAASPLQQKLHTLFESDFPKFLDRMTRLEQAHAAATKKEPAKDAAESGVIEHDEGTTKALSILGAWLDEHGVKREGAA